MRQRTPGSAEWMMTLLLENLFLGQHIAFNGDWQLGAEYRPTVVSTIFNAWFWPRGPKVFGI